MLDRVANTPTRHTFGEEATRGVLKEMLFLKFFGIFTGKHLCWSLFKKGSRPSGLQLFKKETPTQVFSCAYCKIFKNTFVEEHL